MDLPPIVVNFNKRNSTSFYVRLIFIDLVQLKFF